LPWLAKADYENRLYNYTFYIYYIIIKI
jgi:hypothetical protein